MKKLSGFFSWSAVLVMAVLFNLLCGCAVEPSTAEEAVMDQGQGKCECVGTDCKFVSGNESQDCGNGVCTTEGCKDAPVSEFETATLALELDDSIDLKGNCEGNCGPAGVMWCGNATLKGAQYDDRWMCVPYLDKEGKCHMKAVANECDGTEVCVLDGMYPNYGECKTPPLCAKDADCNDQNQCTTDTCVAGMCKFTLNNGAACDDGNKCTLGDACNAFGNCVSGTLKSCDDKESCTGDACDPATGNCVYTAFPDNAVCDDGDKCTLTDKCAAGKCHGTAIVCDDQNACTADSCDELTGQCKFVNVADSTKCDDGLKCTEDDACFAGKCEGQDVDCDDGNPCTADFCDPLTGNCVHNPLPDGTDCFGGKCVLGLCTPDGIWCEAGDPPCRQLGGNLGYWVCETAIGSGYGIWSELQNCGPVAQAVCIDGIGCTKPGAQEVACANGVDDDGDGLTDCADPDCAKSPACGAPVPKETNCTNGLDDDGDGLTDCHDFDCYPNPACAAPPPQVPILTIRYAAYPNPQNMEVYLYCWGPGPSGNFPMGWVPLVTSATCPGADPDYCVTISQGDIFLYWYTADASVLGCRSNLRDAVANKWIPGCADASCNPVYNPGNGAFITYNIVGGPSGTAMSVVDNGAAGRVFQWLK